METPPNEIPMEIKRVIRFLIDRKENFTSIIGNFSYNLHWSEKVRKPKIFRDPNLFCVQFHSDLSNEKLEEELGRYLKNTKMNLRHTMSFL